MIVPPPSIDFRLELRKWRVLVKSGRPSCHLIHHTHNHHCMKSTSRLFLLAVSVPPSVYMFSRIFNSFKSLPAVTLSGPATQPTTATALQSYNSLRTMSSSSSSAPQYFTGASGCFWGTEHIYREHYKKEQGLLDAKVGYIGGKDSSKNPSYQEVCTGRTGHAEAVQIKFDPSKVSYAELVEFLYRTHDPTTKDRQGADRGTQYRSAIFPHDAEQKAIAEKVTAEVQAKHFDPKGQKIVTTIEERPREAFFEGEDYHQQYLHNNPSGYQCSTHRLWW